jgi:hypothetical protein
MATKTADPEAGRALVEKQLIEAAKILEAPNRQRKIKLSPEAYVAADKIYQINSLGSGTRPPGISEDAIKELRREGVLDDNGVHGRGRKYIMKIRPEFLEIDESIPPKKTRAKRSSGVTAPVESVAARKPTVEQVLRLAAAIQREERAVNDKLSLENDRNITRLKKLVGTAEGDDLTRAFNELAKAMAERGQLMTNVREEAFKIVEASSLPERHFLKYLSREPDRA